MCKIVLGNKAFLILILILIPCEYSLYTSIESHWLIT